MVSLLLFSSVVCIFAPNGNNKFNIQHFWVQPHDPAALFRLPPPLNSQVAHTLYCRHPCPLSLGQVLAALSTIILSLYIGTLIGFTFYIFKPNRLDLSVILFLIEALFSIQAISNFILT